MAQGIAYWNGIPVVRAQPVLSDLQRWQERRSRADQPAQAPAWRTAGPPSAMQRVDAGPPPARLPQ